jgi:uncharacterized RDD family membrane protein YckC
MLGESTPRRSESVRSAKTPVNKTCLQCGAILPTGVRVCIFCESSAQHGAEEMPAVTAGNLALNAIPDGQWRGELNQRLQAYRARRRKSGGGEGQSELPFVECEPTAAFQSAAGHEQTRTAVAIDPLSTDNSLDRHEPVDDFAFTIAIGRPPKRREEFETQLLIDVSLPPLEQDGEESPKIENVLPERSGIFPVASLLERRRAAWIDLGCLAFAYGGFLTLFGSLGGQFTLSKLSATVCFFTFAFVYLQYFALFTIFGGTTPGMMIRGLHVTNFSGDAPTLQQLLLRALGYTLSAGKFFLGFLWALWDEDALTWHDRLSHTYLAAPEVFAEWESSQPAATR